MAESSDKADQESIENLERLQLEMCQKLILSDTEDWAQNVDDIELVGGMDISYDKRDGTRGCVTCVVLNAKNDFEMVYKNNSMIRIGNRYVAGFLAFREIDFLLNQYEVLKRNEPKLLPQIWLIDGNGILHPRKFGLASHFGLVTDSPTVGVAKNPYYLTFVDEVVKEAHKKQICQLSKVGDQFQIRNSADEVIGVGLKVTNGAKNPVYVSIGHKVSLDTAVRVVLKCCKFRIPEPTRQADIISREQIRE